MRFTSGIDLMHILPPVTAEGFDGSHHPSYAEWQTLGQSRLFVDKYMQNTEA